MRHHCTACSREFFDDSGGHPRSGEVHCVFCGAQIAKRSRGVPFGDVPRQASFALGVISGSGSGFPDTLRQFRVRPPLPPGLDSLSPLASGSEDDASSPPVAFRGATFWLSLLVGVAAGVALASGFTSSLTKPAASDAARSTLSAPRIAPPPIASVVAAPAPAVAVAPGGVAAPSGSAPPPARAKPIVTPAQERRFLLDLARSHQRQYRLDDAERLYRQVLRQRSADSEALAGLGELALLRGTTDLAAAHFERALSANAHYIPARIAVADLHWQKGEVDEARRAYRDIVQSYAAELYPPYVVQRGEGIGPPACADEDRPVAPP